MPVAEADLVWLETVDLPRLRPADLIHFQAELLDAEREPSAIFDGMFEILYRYQEIDRLDRLDVQAGDTTLPIAHRERIARAFFRTAAWYALVTNELDEGQKAWAVTLLKKTSQMPERILAIWGASEDPHAKLVGALREALPNAKAIEIGRIIEWVCGGWMLAASPERVSAAELRTARRRFAELAATPGVVDAVLVWLPVAPDVERRVLHAGAVLAADGTERCATALRGVLASADDRAWAEQILVKLAPKGSAVAGLLSSRASASSKSRARR